jgi:hypothetical protein
MDYHVMKLISDKLLRNQDLTSLEHDILFKGIHLMRPTPDYGNSYINYYSRANWQEGDYSPIAPFYKFFLLKLAKTMYKYDIITIDPEIDIYKSINEISSLVGLKGKGLWGRIGRLENGYQFLPFKQNDFDELYIKMEEEIRSKWLDLGGTFSQKIFYRCCEELIQTFDFFNQFMGGLSKNSFYDELKYMIFRVKSIIDKAHTLNPIPKYKGTMRSFDRDLLSGFGVEKSIVDAKGGYVIRPMSVDNLKEIIQNTLSTHLSVQQLAEINIFIDDFKSKVFAFHEANSKIENYPDSFRKSLIMDIKNSRVSSALNQPYSANSLSRLLFGAQFDLKTFLTSRKSHTRPEIFTLVHMKLRMLTWEQQDFLDEGLEIDQDTLDKLREEVIEKIDNFIRYSKDNNRLLKRYKKLGGVGAQEFNYYKSKPYIEYFPRRDYELEFELMELYEIAAAVYYGDSKVSPKQLANDIAYSDHVLLASRNGNRLNLDLLKDINKQIDIFIENDHAYRPNKYSFLQRLTSSERQDIYQEVKNKIAVYMQIRNIDYPKAWKREYVKAYHVLNLLKRNLGFDILSFTPLNDDIFKEGGGFARHHFRDDLFRKLSMNLEDLVLTDNSRHARYRQYDELQTLVLIEGFSKLMEMVGSGVNGEITRMNIEQVFTGNEWVLTGEDGWFANERFTDNLGIFNERKKSLKEQGSDEFIEKYYKVAFNRFYLNFPHGYQEDISREDGFYSLISPHPWPNDFLMMLNIKLIGYKKFDLLNRYYIVPFR